MAALPYIQLYVADYLADTAHLNISESGAYLHLIFNYWQTGKPLPVCDKRLAAICRATKEEWDSVKDSVLEFFYIDEGKLHHSRIDSDLKKVAGKGLQNSDINEGWKGYVYFILNPGNNHIKIGYSKNPWSRLKDLQTASSCELLLVATLKTSSNSEAKVHEIFDHLRVGGEWFENDDIIKTTINGIKNGEIKSVEQIITYCSNYETSYQSATVATTKDTDTDTDTNTDTVIKEKNIKKEKSTQKTDIDLLRDFGITGKLALDFKKLRQAKKAPITETALKGILREATKAKLSMEQAVEMSIARNWQGFNADWVKSKTVTADALQAEWGNSNFMELTPEEIASGRFELLPGGVQ